MVENDCRLLILGSLPGEASLRAGRYYAHPQNQFWRLLGSALDEPLAELAYESRLERLRARRVGLWDMVASARRSGSLDGELRDVTANPLAELVAMLPLLRAVAFNGLTAARLGRRALRGTALALVDLPSSSPAYTLDRIAKQSRWDEIARFAG